MIATHFFWSLLMSISNYSWENKKRPTMKTKESKEKCFWKIINVLIGNVRNAIHLHQFIQSMDTLSMTRISNAGRTHMLPEEPHQDNKRRKRNHLHLPKWWIAQLWLTIIQRKWNQKPKNSQLKRSEKFKHKLQQMWKFKLSIFPKEAPNSRQKEHPCPSGKLMKS